MKKEENILVMFQKAKTATTNDIFDNIGALEEKEKNL